MREKIDQFIASYSEWILNWRYLIILIAIVLTLFAGYGQRYMGFENNYRMIFDKNDPQLKAFDALESTYKKNDNVLIVVAPKNGKIFTRENLNALEWLTKQAWKIPYSTRVDSVTNFQNTTVIGDNLNVADLISNAKAMKMREVLKKKEIAVNEPLLVNRLISPKAHVAGINVTVQLPRAKPFAVMESAGFSRNLAQQFKQKYPNTDIYLTGLVMVNEAFPRISMQDMKTLIPLMYIIIAIVTLILLFVISRSLYSIFATICTLFIMFLTITVTMGIAGWMGIKMSPYLSIVPTIILAIGVADAIHIIVHVLTMMRGGTGKRDAVVEAIRSNFKPIFFTAITTIIGFMALNFSNLPPYRALGNLSALGITIVYFYTITFLPALLCIIPLKVKARNVETEKPLALYVANFAIKNHKMLLGVIGIIAVISSLFCFRLELNDNIIDYFSKKVDFRQASEFTMANLTGISRIEYSIGSGQKDGISQPSYLKKLDEFTNWFRKQDHVVHVDSFSDTMKRLNRTMHAGSPLWYKIPDRVNLAAQYLLLYEMSLPYGLELSNQIDLNRSASRFIVTLNDVPSHIILQIAGKGDSWLKQNAPTNMQFSGSGTSVIFAHISDTNLKGMLKGISAELLVIAVLMIIAVGGVRLGLLSMVPNLIPMAMAFGIWALIFPKVNTSIFTPIVVVLGIVVDDTVHFLSRYSRAKKEMNMNTADAIRYAYSDVSAALFATTLILVLGFAVLGFSPYLANWSLGILTALTLSFGLIIELFIMPGLLIIFDRSAKDVHE